MTTSLAKTRKIKYIATVNDEALSESTDPDWEMEYIDIGNVEAGAGITGRAIYRFEDGPSRARRRVRHGDVIVSTVRTYLQAIAAIIDPPPNLIVSTGFAVIRPLSDKLDPDFCRYALREPGFLAEVERRSVGVSYPAINSSDLAAIRIPFPPLPRQRVIAAYLDRETAKIDAMIAAKERLLAILAEKRRALITHSVTCGLNPDASMKDSGVEWLGEIPKHWSTKRAKWLFFERDERSATGDEELLSVSHITGVTPRSEKDVKMFEAASKEGYKVCWPNDLVINTLWAWMGAMGISRNHGIVSPAYHVYEVDEQLSPDYVEAMCRTHIFANEVRRFSKGVWSSRLRLYPEGLDCVQYPIPPLDEQHEIVHRLAEEESKTTAMREALERSLELAKERRSALIAAAVTGQIHVEGEK